MFSSVEKTSVSRSRQQPVNASFFRKTGDNTFVGNKESNTFFTPSIQAKLSVSSPDDPQEKEADAVADKVMRMKAPADLSAPAREEEKLQRKEEIEEETVQAKTEMPVITVQRKEEDDLQAKRNTANIHRSGNELAVTTATDSDKTREEKVSGKNIALHRSDIIQCSGRGPPQSSTVFEHGLSSSKGQGSAMPESTQQFMERRFNADFSGVRIHTGSHAENMSNSINAQAFTHGNDIYFNNGKYSPGTNDGGTLLAHELTHTIQQGASKSNTQKSHNNSISRKPSPSINLKAAAGIFNKIQLSAVNNALTAGIDISNKPGGSALSEEAKDYLQNYYNTSLNDIRIHTDKEATDLCKMFNVTAFAQGKNICIRPSAYNPESENGAILLSEKIADSLKQRGIKTTGKDGNQTNGFNSLSAMIKSAIKENEKDNNKIIKTPSPEKGKSVAADIPKKDVDGKKIKPVKKSIEKKKSKKPKSGDGINIKPVKKRKNKSPATPAEDPAFLKTIKKAKKVSKDQQQHDPAEKKSVDAQNAAEAVPKEAESKAQNRKTDKMGAAAAEDKPFDAATFKADLRKKIEEVTPKNLEEANEFKESKKVNSVKNAMDEKVEQGKQDTSGPVSNATVAPLQVNNADNKQPVSLPPTNKGAKPAGIGAKDAAPKPKMDGEISMQEQSQSLDDEMKANNVTEEQLTTSNEPSFTTALAEKKKAQKDAIEKPELFRKEESVTIKTAAADATQQSAVSINLMHSARGKNFDATVNQQKSTKQKDEEKRAKVSADIEAEYKKAEEKVNIALKAADEEANSIFDTGAEAANKDFENYVSERMNAYKRKRYSGFWGGLRWASDKLFGMPDEVNEFYTEGRRIYIDQMDKVIDNVANAVTIRLNEAKQAIKDGKKAIDDYVKKLPEDLQSVGKEAAESIQDKFDSLEQTVNDKRDGLIDGLAKKYVENVKKLDERINELKEANKGLIDKAIGFLKKVWKVIKDLVNLFTTILSRLASIIGLIIDSPGGFFDNLGKAFNKGFNNFKDKFLDYLEKGLMEWLATNLGIAGIELPEKFTPGAILSLALQVMGITKQHIRERAVVILGERKVKLLENAGGILYRIYTEGLGALWDMIVEKITDFKEIIWEAIKSFIKTKIIEAAITFLLSLLNPIGAFIKVCMAIYDFLMMLVRFKDKIIELLDTILNAVMSVASGAIDGAAAAIEKAFAKSIPIIIAFLAALLHLNDIAAKVKTIIMRIRTRIDKAIDFAIQKGYSLVGKLVEGALRIEDKGMAMVEKGKEKIVQVGKAGIAAIANWWNAKMQLKTKDGESHTIYFEGKAGNARLMIASTPITVRAYILKIKDDNNFKDADIKKPVNTVERIETKEKENAVTDDQKTQQVNDISNLMTQLSLDLAELPLEKAGVNSNAIYGGTYQGAFGTSAVIAFQQAPFKRGSEPNVDHPTYSKINIRKDGGGSYYVKGHLINDNLGGPGTQWANLTPLNRDANKDHQLQFEDIVKNAVNGTAARGINTEALSKQGYTKGFGVTVTYGRSEVPALTHLKDESKDDLPPGADPGWNMQELKELLEAEKTVPSMIRCTATIKKKGAAAEEQVAYTVKNNINYGILSQYQLGVKPKTTVTLASLINTSAKTEKEMTDSFKTINGIGTVRAKKIYDTFRSKGRITNGKADIGIGLLALNNMNEGKNIHITSGNISWPVTPVAAS